MPNGKWQLPTPSTFPLPTVGKNELKWKMHERHKLIIEFGTGSNCNCQLLFCCYFAANIAQHAPSGSMWAGVTSKVKYIYAHRKKYNKTHTSHGDIKLKAIRRKMENICQTAGNKVSVEVLEWRNDARKIYQGSLRIISCYSTITSPKICQAVCVGDKTSSKLNDGPQIAEKTASPSKIFDFQHSTLINFTRACLAPRILKYMTRGAGSKVTNIRGYIPHPNLKYCMFAPISPLSPHPQIAWAFG